MFSSSQNTLITGGIFVDHRVQFHSKGGFERLQEAVAPGAFHNSGERFDPPKCHPNTRVAVIKRLMDWILRLDSNTRDALIMWLYGPAGAGKSAIAQTLAELCYAEKKLLASFFFSKNDPRRSTAQALVATLAYQLALVLPHQVREHITSIVEHDPLIFTRSLETQLTALIVEPIQHLAESGYFNDPQAPCLIIIDGLDECDSSRVQCNILDVVFKSFQQRNIPLLYLIASRPETDISSYFDSQSATSMLARLGLDGEYRPDADIRLYLIEKFEEIKQNHRLRKYIPDLWPTSDIIDNLVSKSSGQFIYASTVVKFVASARHRPIDRLEIILGARPCSGQTPFAELDALYTHIFSTVEDIESVLTIVGFLVFGSRSSPNTFLWHDVDNKLVEDFFSLNPGDLCLILGDISSLISVTEESYPCILHASLKDFLCDESRSKRLYLNPAERHTQYALIGFKHIRTGRANGLITLNPFYHCRHSAFTEELRLNIDQLSFESLFTTLNATPSSLAFTICMADFFSLLESLPWDEDKLLYKEQLNSLDRVFMDNLDTYYSDPFLSLLVGTLPLVSGRAPFIAIPKACLNLDSHRLRLHPAISLNAKYREIFLDFIQDPGRSGKYFLDGAKYGRAALGALTYLSNHWSHKRPSFPSKFDKNIRRHAPRKWRERWGKNSLLRKIRSQARLNLHLTFYLRNWWDHPAKKKFEWTEFSERNDHSASAVFYFALLTLPLVLHRSDKSKELVQFSRQIKFGSRTKDYPKDSKLARRAITEYLARASEEV